MIYAIYSDDNEKLKTTTAAPPSEVGETLMLLQSVKEKEPLMCKLANDMVWYGD